MTPLIDADLLTYEVAFSGQMKDDDGEVILSPFESVKDILDDKVKQICAAVWATEEPILYLTGKGNFREKIAVSKPYKGNRKSEKPFHYKNLRAYIQHAYNTVLVDGMEADDAMVIEQVSRLDKLDTVICSRDKDLRIAPGMHYGWEVSGQDAFPLTRISELGFLNPVVKTKTNKDGEEVEYISNVKGGGLKFFYAQMIMGDSTDNIPGLPRSGPILAYKTVDPCESEQELFETVSQLYRDKMGANWEEYMLEQGRLLWMCQRLSEDGSPVMWELPNG